MFWKPVDYLLEDEFDCWLLNARHLRNVPVRPLVCVHGARVDFAGVAAHAQTMLRPA